MSNDFHALRVEYLGRGSTNVVTSPAWLKEGTRRVVDFRSGVVLDHDNFSRSRLLAYSYQDDMCLTGGRAALCMLLAVMQVAVRWPLLEHGRFVAKLT